MRTKLGHFGLLITLFALLIPSLSHAGMFATDGSLYLYLSTGPGGNGGGSTGIDRNGNGGNEFDEARAQLGFNAGPGGTLSFAYNLLTSEFNDDGVQDLVIVSIDGVPVLQGGIMDTVGNFPPIGPFTGPVLEFPDGSRFDDGELGTRTFFSPVSSGPHTITFQVLDDFDDLFDTALLVDELALDGTVIESFEDDVIGLPPGTATEVIGNVSVVSDSMPSFLPEPTSLGLLLVSLLGVTSWKCRASRASERTT